MLVLAWLLVEEDFIELLLALVEAVAVSVLFAHETTRLAAANSASEENTIFFIGVEVWTNKVPRLCVPLALGKRKLSFCRASQREIEKAYDFVTWHLYRLVLVASRWLPRIRRQRGSQFNLLDRDRGSPPGKPQR